MKRIYFVRHGQSEGNANELRGHVSHQLTKRGREQAAFIAERCANLPIDCIISSTVLRAKETAGFIAEKLNMVPEYSDLFVEARSSSNVTGKPRTDEGAIAAQAAIDANFHVPGFRYEDAENFEDLNERARQALDLLAHREEDSVLVVTHGFFMRIIMARVVHGDDLTAELCRDFIRSFHLENTGLTVLGYDETKLKPWWVWIWNDHAHLG